MVIPPFSPPLLLVSLLLSLSLSLPPSLSLSLSLSPFLFLLSPPPLLTCVFISLNVFYSFRRHIIGQRHCLNYCRVVSSNHRLYQTKKFTNTSNGFIKLVLPRPIRSRLSGHSEVPVAEPSSFYQNCLYPEVAEDQ